MDDSVRRDIEHGRRREERRGEERTVR